MGSHLDSLVPIALAIAGSFIGNPELGLLGGIGGGLGAAGGAALGAGLGSAGVNYSQTHNFGDALKSGALSAGGTYLGGQAIGAIAPDVGTVGSTLGLSDASSSGLPGVWDASTARAGSSSIADSLGGAAGSAYNSALNAPILGAGGTGASSVLGSYTGNQLASQYAPPGQPSNRGNYPFAPQAVGIGSAPGSLNSMASLTPQQQASSLATQGVYGGGNGPQEQGYFGNLIQNQLYPSAGHQQDLSTLSPVENDYLGKLGFGGYGNSGSSSNLLEQLSKWNPSA